MKVAYHNFWNNSAENQIFWSLRKAGTDIGVEVFQCADENDILGCDPDFVLSVSPGVAKITDLPSYVTVHEPISKMLAEPRYVQNLLSYDGYLTISDSLSRFIKHLSFGAGRAEEPGFFFLTPHLNDLRVNWNRLDLRKSLRVAYFGTNWPIRMPLLLRALDSMGIMRIYGPEESWKSQRYKSYCGPVPFDGLTPQRIYAESGLGLALLDERWQREDIVSNRIFEISSVGAVSICPDMPWVRRWFGDSVFYFDPEKPMREIAEQVKEFYTLCLLKPKMAAQMSGEARRIFETHFAAERMLSNLVTYHEDKTKERAKRLAAMPPAPEITVVVRCGGRSLGFVKRAVDSIRNQSYGKFCVILARYREIDLSTITEDLTGSITNFEDVFIHDGTRAQMLFEGVKRVTSTYFAVLDDDDFWLSDHIEELFRAGRQVRNDFDVAFSGAVGIDYPVKYGGVSFYRNIWKFGFGGPINDVTDAVDAIPVGSFVAKTSLLSPEMLQVPDMRTGEDTFLLCLLLRRSKPIFSFRATCFYRFNSADGSNWKNDPQRAEDEIAFAYRGGLIWSPEWLADGSLAAPNRVFAQVRTKLGNSTFGEYITRIAHIDVGCRRDQAGIVSPANRQGWICSGPPITLSPGWYTVTFLIIPNLDFTDKFANQPFGYVEVAVSDQAQTLAEEQFLWQDEELVLVFEISAAMADWPVEFRVFSYGRNSFTISSIGLHRYEPGANIMNSKVHVSASSAQFNHHQIYKSVADETRFMEFGEGYIYSDDDKAVVLNRSARIVFELCDGERSITAIANEIKDMFSLPKPPLDDTERCINSLHSSGFLVPYGYDGDLETNGNGWRVRKTKSSGLRNGLTRKPHENPSKKVRRSKKVNRSKV